MSVQSHRSYQTGARALRAWAPYAGRVSDHLPPEPPDGPRDDHEVGAEATPWALLGVVAAVATAQGLALVGLAAAELLSVDAARVGLGVSTAIFFAALGGLLLAGAAAILRLQSWARGFLSFAQLLCLALSFNFRGEAGWITPTMAVPALVALGCLVSPSVTRALGRDEPV